MPWVITIHITDCANNHNLASAFVTDGYSTAYADAYGDVAAIIYDDVDPAYGVNIGKSGYVTRYTVLYQSQANSTIQVCLNVAPAPPPSTGGGKCFIVSATTGSTDSAENMRLNMLRDRVLRSTDIGAALYEAIYRDYYSFSPAIAAELTADAKLRNQVLRVAVRPLLAWYGLVEVLALERDASDSVLRAADAVVAACQPEARATADQTAALCGMIRRGELLPVDAPAPFPYLASRVTEAVALPFAAWAIFAPLALAWECAASGADVVACATTWLSQAPLEQIPPPVGSDRIEAELAQLANGPFASPPLRREVGARLLEVWPHLEVELLRHDFIADGRGKTAVPDLSR